MCVLVTYLKMTAIHPHFNSVSCNLCSLTFGDIFFSWKSNKPRRRLKILIEKKKKSEVNWCFVADIICLSFIHSVAYVSECVTNSIPAISCLSISYLKCVAFKKPTHTKCHYTLHLFSLPFFSCFQFFSLLFFKMQSALSIN